MTDQKESLTDNVYHISIRLVILIILIILAAIFLYRSALTVLMSDVIHREGSSHGVFVPFISAYFIWINRENLKQVEIRSSFIGILIIAVSLIPLILSSVSFQLLSISFFLLISGLIVAVLGLNFFRQIAFPLLFLITMIPIPTDIYIAIANKWRDIPFTVSTFIISLLGLTFYQDGYFIHFHNTSLEVAISCSGIRYLISYFVFGLAYAYLTRTGLKSRLIIILSVFPISLLASIFRLTFIYLGTYYISPRTAETVPHILISWSVFFGMLMMSIALDQFFLKKKEAGSDAVK